MSVIEKSIIEKNVEFIVEKILEEFDKENDAHQATEGSAYAWTTDDYNNDAETLAGGVAPPIIPSDRFVLTTKPWLPYFERATRGKAPPGFIAIESHHLLWGYESSKSQRNTEYSWPILKEEHNVRPNQSGINLEAFWRAVSNGVNVKIHGSGSKSKLMEWLFDCLIEDSYLKSSNPKTFDSNTIFTPILDVHRRTNPDSKAPEHILTECLFIILRYCDQTFSDCSCGGRKPIKGRSSKRDKYEAQIIKDIGTCSSCVDIRKKCKAYSNKYQSLLDLKCKYGKSVLVLLDGYQELSQVQLDTLTLANIKLPNGSRLFQYCIAADHPIPEDNHINALNNSIFSPDLFNNEVVFDINLADVNLYTNFDNLPTWCLTNTTEEYNEIEEGYDTDSSGDSDMETDITINTITLEMKNRALEALGNEDNSRILRTLVTMQKNFKLVHCLCKAKCDAKDCKKPFIDGKNLKNELAGLGISATAFKQRIKDLANERLVEKQDPDYYRAVDVTP